MAVPANTNQPGLSRWDPMADLDRLSTQLRSYVDRFGSLGPLFEGAFTPLGDVEETDDAYLVEVELPGIKREDVSLEVSDARLSVSGERKERERVGILRRRTRTVGRFHYEVALPGQIDEGVPPRPWTRACSPSECPSPPRTGLGASPSADHPRHLR